MDYSTKAGVLAYAEKKRGEAARCWEKLGRFEINGFSYGATLLITHEPPSIRDMYRAALKLAAHERLMLPPGPKLPRVVPMAVNLPRWMHGLDGAETFAGHTKQREIFSEAVKAFAKMTKAVGVVFTSEAWTLKMPVVPGKTLEQQRAEFPDDLADAENRSECLFVSVEHRALERPILWRAFIKTDPRRLEPWAVLPLDATVGRMTGLAGDWRS